MKAVKLTNRIRYFHCPGDEEGAHGVMVLLGAHGYPTKAEEVETQADFKFWFRAFSLAEETQDELSTAPRTGYATSV